MKMAQNIAEENQKQEIETAAFGNFGQYIAESWSPNILNKCHILEKVSLKSFISGKGYKRSKGAHHLLALAREVLHYQSFLESNETTETSYIIFGHIFNLETDDSCDLNLSKVINEIFKEYKECQKNTENGIHGKTAQH